MDKVQQKIISDVLEERERQNTKWGEQNHFVDKWGNIIGEEYGEVCKAINEFGFNPTPQTEQDIYTEAIQTMASCMAMLECMERNKPEQSNKKRFVYICSPLRGEYETNIMAARNYCREIVDLYPDVVPIAPHIYCTQFLDDEKPNERAAGIDMGLALLNICSEVWVYGIQQPSDGMKNEIEYAQARGIPVRAIEEIYKSHEREATPL